MYNGILLRANSHQTLATTDPLIHRELAMSANTLGIAFDSGSGVEVTWLNFKALAAIGKILDGTGSTQDGVKTSDMPIVFDNSDLTSDLFISSTEAIFKGSYKLRLQALSRIKTVTNSTIVITDNLDPETTVSINLPALAAIRPVPVLGAVTTTTVAVGFSTATSVVVVDEAEAILGTLTASGTLTFSTPQTSGARIYAYTLDVHKNKSARTSILIP